jgi:hypothetical protein
MQSIFKNQKADEGFSKFKSELAGLIIPETAKQ